MWRILLSIAVAILSSGSAIAGDKVFFPLNDNPSVAIDKYGHITITENGAPGQNVVIQPTGFMLDKDRKPTGPDVPVGPHKSAKIGDNGTTPEPFEFASIYGNSAAQAFQVYDYTQQLGDPAILSAAAFEGGAPRPLLDWLVSHGYSGSHPIIQPDFFSTDGSPMFVAVDLALLGEMGALFTATHSYGDIFTIGGTDMLAALPGELFSTTLPVLGVDGWEVTPLADGTQVVYGGFHSTTGDIPEPSTWAMMLLGMGCVGAMRRRLSRHGPARAF